MADRRSDEDERKQRPDYSTSHKRRDHDNGRERARRHDYDDVRRKEKRRSRSRSKARVEERDIYKDPGRKPLHREENREDKYRLKDDVSSKHRHRSSPRSRSRSPRHDRRRVSRSPHSSHRRSKRARSTSRSPSRSPPRRRRRHSSPRSPSPPPRRSNAPLPSQQDAFSNDLAVVRPDPVPEKQKPNYSLSGKLAADTNTVAGTDIVLKYNEPPDSRKPPASQPWRMYVFKGQDTLADEKLYERSCWLFGRERQVVDVPTEHPSCSKQHAVLQFRHVSRKNEYGDVVGGVKLYLIDLESSNGTRLNGTRLEARRYVEVRSGDVIGFGDSEREYVVMLPPKDGG